LAVDVVGESSSPGTSQKQSRSHRLIQVEQYFLLVLSLKKRNTRLTKHYNIMLHLQAADSKAWCSIQNINQQVGSFTVKTAFAKVFDKR